MKTTRTSLFLMSNLGSEVARIFSAKEKGNGDMLESATNRAKNILLELKGLPDVKNNAEIGILENIINDIGESNRKYEISSEQLMSYFYPFTARLMNM